MSPIYILFKGYWKIIERTLRYVEIRPHMNDDTSYMLCAGSLAEPSGFWVLVKLTDFQFYWSLWCLYQKGKRSTTFEILAQKVNKNVVFEIWRLLIIWKLRTGKLLKNGANWKNPLIITLGMILQFFFKVISFHADFQPQHIFHWNDRKLQLTQLMTAKLNIFKVIHMLKEGSKTNHNQIILTSLTNRTGWTFQWNIYSDM